MSGGIITLSDGRIRATGWRAIAKLLNCSIRTAQRYKEQGAPISSDRYGAPVCWLGEIIYWLDNPGP